MGKSFYGRRLVDAIVINGHVWMFFHATEDELHDLLKCLPLFSTVCGNKVFVAEFSILVIGDTKEVFQTTFRVEGVALDVEIHIAGRGLGKSIESALVFYRENGFM